MLLWWRWLWATPASALGIRGCARRDTHGIAAACRMDGRTGLLAGLSAWMAWFVFSCRVAQEDSQAEQGR